MRRIKQKNYNTKIVIWQNIIFSKENEIQIEFGATKSI